MSQSPKLRGSYILIIEVTERRRIEVGSLGSVDFPQGNYAYLGSAQGGLRARVGRHLSKDKKLHWHIDYLLREAEVVEIILCPNSAILESGKGRLECFLAQDLAREFPFIPRFGSSDCHCPSHLYFATEKAKLRARIIRAITKDKLAYQCFSREEAKQLINARIHCGR
jgi:Uri superfamily endonuclease